MVFVAAFSVVVVVVLAVMVIFILVVVAIVVVVILVIAVVLAITAVVISSLVNDDSDDLAVLQAMFPQELKKHLEAPENPSTQASQTHPTGKKETLKAGTHQYALTIQGHRYEVQVEEVQG